MSFQVIHILLIAYVGFVLLLVKVVYFQRPRSKFYLGKKKSSERMDFVSVRYSPKVLEEVEDSPNVKKKLLVVSALERETRRRLERTMKKIKKYRSELFKEKLEHDSVTTDLKTVRRELVTAEPKSALRMIQARGSEIFKGDWGKSVENKPSLSELLIGPIESFESNEETDTKVHPIVVSPSIPKLNLDLV